MPILYLRLSSSFQTLAGTAPSLRQAEGKQRVFSLAQVSAHANVFCAAVPLDHHAELFNFHPSL